jgi:hypothetical protein
MANCGLIIMLVLRWSLAAPYMSLGGISAGAAKLGVTASKHLGD